MLSNEMVIDNFVVYNLYGIGKSDLSSHNGMEHKDNKLIYDRADGVIAAYHSGAFTLLSRYGVPSIVVQKIDLVSKVCGRLCRIPPSASGHSTTQIASSTPPGI